MGELKKASPISYVDSGEQRTSRLSAFGPKAAGTKSLVR
jgi:hypothetical protein